MEKVNLPAPAQKIESATTQLGRPLKFSLPNLVIEEIAKETESSQQLVQIVHDGMNRQIRRIPDMDAKLGITAVLKKIAESYGSASEQVAPHTIAECVRLVQSQFGGLSLDEIREAYRLWAANKTDAGKRGEMYGGALNAAQLGAVLAAYLENRRTIVVALANAQADIRKQEDSERRTARQKIAFAEQFPADVNELIKTPDISWKDVPGWWYDTLEKYGCISVPIEEKREIFAEAKQVAAAELYEQRAKTGVLEAVTLKKDIDDLLAGIDLSRAQRIAKKMCVFHYIVAPYAIEGKTFVLPELPELLDNNSLF